jgi:hypothetical protein
MIYLRLAGAALFVLSIFVSGYWLSRSGKPYNGILFNLHKLIALAALVLLVINLLQVNRLAPISPLLVIASAVTILLIIALFVTGALASTGRTWPAIVLTLHHIMPYLAVLATIATQYLLIVRA